MFERKLITRITYCISCVIFILTLPLACSSVPNAVPTSYKSAKTANGYGYSSTQLSDNEYRVMFKATDLTPADLVQEYTLRRAAELADKHNYAWVTVVKTDIEKKQNQGKTVVRKKTDKQVKLPQDQQCTMSGCTEVAQPFTGNGDDIEVQTTPMSDIYYSIVVRMSATKPDVNALQVSQLLDKTI